ncbi:sensor histidine kinase [Pseudomonas sp. CFBP 8758]|uniref:sensor histidine kinase n=1 Tax=Pseudomonas sp. CFBP 8758 TaxID=2775286 RepID=UPI00313C973A
MTGSRAPRLAVIVLVIVAGALLSAVWAGRHAQLLAQNEEAARSNGQLALYANSLHTLIERYRTLPAVLALDPQLQQSLQGPIDPATQNMLNRKLERINAAARSSTLELLDSQGLAVAASNWRLPTSYVGHNYAFRPYFSQSVSQGSGRFYAVGVTSGIPGYFLSSAIKDARDGFLGAMVVKLELPELEQEWAQGPDTLLVSDARGVVFIANRPGWRYRTLHPLSEADRAELQRTRQYHDQALQPLDHQVLGNLDGAARHVRVNGPQGTADYLWASLPMASEGWTLHLLKPPMASTEDSRNAALAAAGLWLSLVFGGLWLNQRRRLAALRQRGREQLESLVRARTRELRDAQEGLVQAAKLAALGQMSAALAHEISQPLTAQRMQLASLRLLLDQDRIDAARQALAPLEQMLVRMAALTTHLKTFARKSPAGVRERVDLAQVLDQALQLLETPLHAAAVRLHLQVRRPACVRGDVIRLEQVLINLLRNALDAMTGVPAKDMHISLQLHGEQWQLDIADSGGGIASEHLEHLFDPFFTTKPIGEGLGLGLAVSLAIAHEHGGQLSAENLAHGARFTLALPIDTEPA